MADKPSYYFMWRSSDDPPEHVYEVVLNSKEIIARKGDHMNEELKDIVNNYFLHFLYRRQDEVIFDYLETHYEYGRNYTDIFDWLSQVELLLSQEVYPMYVGFNSFKNDKALIFNPFKY